MLCYSGELSGLCLFCIGPETLQLFYSLIRLFILSLMILVWICLRERPRGKLWCQKTCKPPLKSRQVETLGQIYQHLKQKIPNRPKPSLHHRTIPVSLIKFFSFRKEIGIHFKKEEVDSNSGGGAVGGGEPNHPESRVLKRLLCKDVLSPKARSEEQLHLGMASTP